MGHQIIGQVFGSKIVQAKRLMHGKTSKIISKKTSILKNLPKTFEATRYHSLIIDKKTLSKNLKIPTTPISEYHQQGQHTTTFAEMYDIDNGAKLIDTPGIKGFGLVNMSKNEISNYFTEFNKFSSRCRFNDCLHLNEPSCAIKKAVNKLRKNKSFMETALRETREEIGVDTNSFIKIQELSNIYIPPSNFMVYPFLFLSNSNLDFSIDKKEVIDLITPTVDQILSFECIALFYNFSTQNERHTAWERSAITQSEHHAAWERSRNKQIERHAA